MRPIYVEKNLYVEREVGLQKETYICEKRPVYVIYVCQVRQLCGHRFAYAGRDLYVRKSDVFLRTMSYTCLLRSDYT